MNALDLNPEPKVVGFRTAIEVLRTLAELMEQHPDLPHPVVNFDYDDAKSEYINCVRFSIWDFGPGKEERSLHKINTIVEAFPDHIQWVPSDPSAEKDAFAAKYFKVKAMWGNVEVTISCGADLIGQEVDVVNAGPQVRLEDGTLHALRQTMHIWRPNPGLSPRIMNQAKALELAQSGPAMQELEATEVF
ncbi:hypothetical protein FDH86_gp081 [Arthrobacter phage Tank]|uniref:Uncharacterized protein n=1 Tax=Arthrobacter phage Tank TaxID=1772319 RepID=A0A0U4KS88_9CAUD|nr:hypothetical protein FDH86_gp081 [Arthrobacter phage Tank]ALY10616.1 hypothetical protein TANK_81 [Arthrobacter phage Tank]